MNRFASKYSPKLVLYLRNKIKDFQSIHNFQNTNQLIVQTLDSSRISSTNKSRNKFYKGYTLTAAFRWFHSFGWHKTLIGYKIFI